MTLLIVAVAVIGLAVVVEGLLLVGLIRAYRELSTTPVGASEMTPAPGHVITSRDMPRPIAEAIVPRLTGRSLIILVTSTCAACDQALKTLGERRDALPLPTILLFERDDADDETARIAALPKEIEVITTTTALHSLAGLGGPSAFPTFIVAADGVVLHSTYVLAEGLTFADKIATTRA